MEEQFILRVPPSVAERIERLLNEGASSSSSSEDASLDLSFSGPPPLYSLRPVFLYSLLRCEVGFFASSHLSLDPVTVVCCVRVGIGMDGIPSPLL